MSACHRCDESLGLLRVEDAKVGAMFKHRCGAVLVIASVGASPNSLVMRLATEAENPSPPKKEKTVR